MSSTLIQGRSPGAAQHSRVQVFFDADCGFCTRSAGVLRRLDWWQRLELVPLQAAAAATVDAPPVDVLLGSMHVRDQAGRWSVGGAAWIRLAREVPLLRPLAIVAGLPIISRLVEPAYSLVATHRHWLSHVLGADACSIDHRAP